MTFNTKGSTTWHHPTIPGAEQKFFCLPPIMKHQDIINRSFPNPINASSLISRVYPPAWWTFMLELEMDKYPTCRWEWTQFPAPWTSKDPPLLLLMILLILQLQHLNPVFGQAVLDLNTIEVIHPTVEVSDPKDYLMIVDHGWGRLSC